MHRCSPLHAHRALFYAPFIRPTKTACLLQLRFSNYATRPKSTTPNPADPEGQSAPLHRLLGQFVLTSLLVGTLFGTGAFTWLNTQLPWNANKATPLNPATFTDFELIAKEPVSSTSSIFTFRPANTRKQQAQQSYDEAWRQGVWSVEIKQPQLQIARSYTPLPPTGSLVGNAGGGSQPYYPRSGDLRILVRREPQGEVSSYLHGLGMGAKLEFRGPHVEYTLPSDVKQVVFVAGGTGIAPALQIVHALGLRVDPAAGKLAMSVPSGVHILWANRRREDCMGGRSLSGKIGKVILSEAGIKGALVQDLDEMAQPSRAGFLPTLHLGADYFVDEEGTRIRNVDIARAMASIVKAGELSYGRKLILVSGPEGFINYVAGRKSLQNGVEAQGSIGGLLARIDLKDWEVWKL